MRCFGYILSGVVLALSVHAQVQTMAIGNVAAGSSAYFDLPLKNEGTVPVFFSASITSCDCVQVLGLPITLKPGESAIVPCSYTPAMTGQINVDVKIEGSDSSASSRLFRITGYVGNRDWFISADELISDKTGKFMIIDVRENTSPSNLPVPRSIPLPLFSLKNRTALKEKAIVLIHDGAGTATLLDAIQGLRSMGFSHVQILQGGLAAWVRKSAQTKGVDGGASSAATISAADFTRSAVSFPWIIVDTEETENFSAVVTQRKSSQNVLIVAPEQEYPRIESELARAQKNDGVYYLRGGKKALDTWRANQLELGAHTGELIQVRPSSSHPAVAGKCGSCGAK